MKLVTDLGENEVIHCPTIEEAEAICRLMDGAGLRWRTDRSYQEHHNWKTYEEYTCYIPNNGTFCGVQYATKRAYTIHKASEFLTKTK
jgi:hypothetical protein